MAGVVVAGVIVFDHGTRTSESKEQGTVAVEPGISATFSIAAIDTDTGACGAAVASHYPAVGKLVPYVRAGVGAFCTQHHHNPDWGETALDLLASGRHPAQVISRLLADDSQPEMR